MIGGMLTDPLPHGYSMFDYVWIYVNPKIQKTYSG